MPIRQRSRAYLLLPIILPLAFVSSGGNRVATDREQSSSVVLQATEMFFTDVLAMATGTYKGQQRFYVFHSKSITIYNEDRSISSSVDTSGNFYPIDPSVDSEGNVYLINSATDEIVILSPTGEWRRSFRVQERPYSLALLSNGNIVIASPNGGKLVHIYDTSGRKLRSFGDIKPFDGTNEAQNLFLNRGKVVVDSSDDVYFVFKYAPIPSVMKFSGRGKVISEFGVDGYAIDLQVEPARKYLVTKPSSQVGGFVITNSAAIDPSTGHLWICMNGSSRSGVVYEYTQKGKKIREYSIIKAVPSIRPFALTYVTGILFDTPSIYVIVDDGVYFLSSNKAVAPGDFVFSEEACPSAESWGGCSANCTCPAPINCKSILQAQIPGGLRIVGSSCSSLGPGQGTPAKPNGGCIATVTTCDASSGEQVTHSTNQDCSPVKYKCSGSNCVADCNGAFTTSNCNNTCTSGSFEACEPCVNNNDCTSCDLYGYCDGGSHYCYSYSPIVLDIDGDGYRMTSAARGVAFDMNGDGPTELLSWTAPGSDEAWLALDRNGNGVIDNGTELFGNFTPQPPSASRNGFIALAEYDKTEAGGNGDGRIDHSDSIFSSLRLWQDTNHNGLSEPGELHRLPRLGVYAISLDYRESRRTDEFGNRFRYRAKVYDSHNAHVGRWAWDVYLVRQ